MKSFPREYLPPDFDAGDPAALDERVDELATRPLPDRIRLEAWLLDMDELFNACFEEGQRRGIAATRDNADRTLRERWDRFAAEMDGRIKASLFALEKRLLRSPFRHELDHDRFGQYLKALSARHALHRVENHPLFGRAAAVTAAYHRLRAGACALFEKDRLPVGVIELFERMPDRRRRAAAWRVRWSRIGEDAPRFHELYDRLVRLNQRIARNAGCPDYLSYLSLHLGRPYDFHARAGFQSAVARRAVPLLAEMQARRRADLRVATLRPWDESYRPEGRPWRTPDELLRLARRALRRVDEEFARRLDWMTRAGLVDFGGRPSKDAGHYVCPLHESRLPFLFMNTASPRGGDDLGTLVREGGHAVRAFEVRELRPRYNRTASVEFSLAASLALEFMALDGAEDLCPAAESRRLRRAHLERTVLSLCRSVLLDAFELTVYREEEPRWRDLFRLFRGRVDYTGLEEAEENSWIVERTLFFEPGRAIEGGVALLCALQLWRNYRNDRCEAVRAYRRALALGGTRPLLRLLATAGVQLDLGDGMVARLMEMVADAWEDVSLEP